MKKQLYHGASLYPELWSREVLEQDIARMKELGINVVRMGEFTWSVLEPEQDQFDFSLFQEVIPLLYAHGIETIMCTPTPTPPIWMTYGHPERMFVDQQGTVMHHGARQHICTNNPFFRERAALLAAKLGEALSSLPGLIAWQLDNEFKAHVSECMCTVCSGLWHEWLKARYETIERLNDAWGTNIWSQAYQRFEQVPQPLPAPFLHNSSLLTMYQLFSMEKIAEFADEQAAILRCYSDLPITHNSSVAFHVDNERLFKQLDFASYDTYASLENRHAYLLNCDLWRNLKPGRPFWVMETSPSYAGSLQSYAAPHPNGYVKAEAVAAYALGAGGFCYWLWRQQRTGSEQPHGSVISAWGEPTVGYHQVQEAETARGEIEQVILSSATAQAQVAITYSDQAKAFLRTEPHRKLHYRSLMGDFYKHFLSMGIHRDLLPEGASLEGYKLLFTPFLPYVSAAYLSQALAFTAAGGIWVAGPLTGGREEDHTIPVDHGLGKLEAAAGVHTKYIYPMEGTGTIGQAFGTRAPLSLWSAVFEIPEGAAATSMGEIVEGITPGYSFLTECPLGLGKLVMLGSLPIGAEGETMLTALINHYAAEAGVTMRFDATPGTLVAPRHGEETDYWIIVNMDGEGGSVTLPEAGLDALTGLSIPAGPLPVGSFEHRVIAFPIKT